MRAHIISLTIILVCSVVSLRAMFHPGFMYAHDSLWHVERLQNMSSLLRLEFPVRWSPSLDNGYGVPLFNFTYPAPYYLGAGFMALGLGPIKAYDLLLLLAYIGGGIGMYVLGRKRPWIGLVAALLYLLTPYQFLDIFVRGALGEVVALGLIPWVLIAMEQVSASGKLHWYTPLPFALLVLSHNFYGYLYGALLVGSTLFLYRHKLRVFASLVLSLSLSAFFLLPAFFEKNFLLFSQSDHLGYRNHFVYLSQLIYSKWSYFGSLPGNDPREMSYQLGLSGLVILVLCLSLLIFRRKLSSRLTWYLFVVGLSIYMMLPVSDFLWQTIPLLSSIQFPWRFLGITTLMFPLIYLELASHQTSRWFHGISIGLVVLAILNTRNYTRPVKWLTAEEFQTFHYEYVGKTTTAQRNEIVPKWSRVERYEAGNIPQLPDARLENYTVTPLSISWSVAVSSPENLVIPRNYFPTWEGTVDGRKIVLTPAENGDIVVPLVAGQHSYRITYASTGVETAGNLISLFAVLAIGYLYVQGRKPKLRLK